MKLRVLLGIAVAAIGIYFLAGLFSGGDQESDGDNDVVVVIESMEQPAGAEETTGDVPGEASTGEPQESAGSATEGASTAEGGDRSDGGDRKSVPLRRESPADTEVANIMAVGRWQEALDKLEARRAGAPLSSWELGARYRCLVKLGRTREADAALDGLLSQRPMPPEAMTAALDVVDGLKDANAKRALLSRLAPGFDVLKPEQATRVAAILAALNGSLPQSIEGQFRFDSYTIQPNDSLWNICNDYNRRKDLNVEVGLICWLNGLQGTNIYPDQVLKLPTEKLSVRVWKSSWFMGVFLGETLLTAYRVGLGRNGKTPTGSFIIRSKLKDPDWNSRKLGRIVPAGHPDNILGTRWLGFENTQQHQGYGVHGTKQPDSIGKNESDGCIRLLNEDVEELFELVSRGTVVEIS